MLVPLATLYLGVFVILRNHYIMRPRIEGFLNNALIYSTLVRELIIDFISNLSSLAFLLSSIILTNKDHGLATIVLSDTFWAGLFFALVAAKNITLKPELTPKMKIIIKNGLFLCLSYGVIVYHYIADLKLFTLGIGMLGIYGIHLLIIAYEERFFNFIDDMLEIKRENY